MLVLAVLLAACAPGSVSTSAPPPAPPPAAPLRTVIEDGGEIHICYRGDSRELEAYVTAGCYSSSCTHTADVDGSAEVEQRSSIRFQTHFELWRDPMEKYCTADCGGGGSLTLRLGDLPAGTYTVWLGDKQVGVVEVPETPPAGRQGDCLYIVTTPMPTEPPWPEVTPFVYPW